MEKYKFLKHTADVKFQAFGKTIEEAFENASLATAETMTKKTKIAEKIKWKIDASGKDLPSLLYNFLEEFLFLLDAEDFLLSRVLKIKIKGEELEAEVIGDKASNYKITNDVKAVTYNEMFVKQRDGKWICQCVLDV
jgi:SHS2 domain-containing protein